MAIARQNVDNICDINHSRIYAKYLDKAIYKTMKYDIQDNMNCLLDATQSKRPAGLVMDKMTPNKRTGQIHALIIPIPENPLTKDLLVPLMLEVPPVHNHSAQGLAESAKEIFNDAGLSDNQLEGSGWDGEYIKKGVKNKLIIILNISDMTDEEKTDWITEVWEPAHQIELTTKDARNMDIFEWLEDHIKIINDITTILNIGKGLEQSIEAAREVGEKLYILKTLSDTRFSAYFEKSIENFEKRIETTITALKKRAESKNKEVKEKASNLLKRVCNKQLLLLNLDLLDIYRRLGSISC